MEAAICVAEAIINGLLWAKALDSQAGGAWPRRIRPIACESARAAFTFGEIDTVRNIAVVPSRQRDFVLVVVVPRAAVSHAPARDWKAGRFQGSRRRRRVPPARVRRNLGWNASLNRSKSVQTLDKPPLHTMFFVHLGESDERGSGSEGLAHSRKTSRFLRFGGSIG
jgi:hypothetical protein